MHIPGWLAALLSLYVLYTGISETVAETRRTSAQKCPMRTNPNDNTDAQLARLYPGRFQRKGNYQSLEKNTGKLLRFRRMRKLTEPKNRMKGRGGSSSCCERSDYIVKPLQVQDANTKTKHDVVHLKNHDQLFTIGECKTLNKRCSRYFYRKRCRPYKLIEWILVWDKTVKWHPQVKYVKVWMNAGCHCTLYDQRI